MTRFSLQFLKLPVPIIFDNSNESSCIRFLWLIKGFDFGYEAMSSTFAFSVFIPFADKVSIKLVLIVKVSTFLMAQNGFEQTTCPTFV